MRAPLSMQGDAVIRAATDDGDDDGEGEARPARRRRGADGEPVEGEQDRGGEGSARGGRGEERREVQRVAQAGGEEEHVGASSWKVEGVHQGLF